MQSSSFPPQQQQMPAGYATPLQQGHPGPGYGQQQPLSQPQQQPIGYMQQGYPSQSGYMPEYAPRQSSQPGYPPPQLGYPQQQPPQPPQGYGQPSGYPQQPGGPLYPPPQQPQQQQQQYGYPPQQQQQQQQQFAQQQQSQQYGYPQQQQQQPPQQIMYGQPSYTQQQQPPPPAAARTTTNPNQRGRLSRPPYVDPVTNIIYDTDNADYEGWLTKQSMWLKEWRRRYFVLKGSKLFFCKNEYSAPHGMMDLAQCTTVKSADLKAKKRHSLEISTPETCYLLYADTESEKDDWIGRVGKAIVRCSRTYYATGNNQNQQSAADAHEREEDDDIYTNDDPDNPYFND